VLAIFAELVGNRARRLDGRVSTMPDLRPVVEAIRERPDDEGGWLALAGWLQDQGRDDEAAAARMFWPTLREDLGRK
jgi:uncharacterized protein (TIGR02996 family)